MKDSIIENWQAALNAIATKEKVKILSSFFKTGRGEYGEGDLFIGVTVPNNRSIAKEYYDAPLEAILEMLNSPYHEFRLSALLAIVHSYKKSKTQKAKDAIIDFYLENCHKCNNWDLVDLSAPYLLGNEIAAERRHDDLNRLSSSPNLWHRRIAVVSTLTAIRKNNLNIALEQCKIHISDKEPLMQKAVGWVLREVGKKSFDLLKEFLDSHISKISAITLSYACEKFDKPTRHYYQQLRRSIAKHPS